jgi:hypothetical protein
MKSERRLSMDTGGRRQFVRGWWTERRIRVWGIAALVLAWLPVIGVPGRGFLDVSAFYIAAQFAFTPDVVRLDPIVLAQHAAGLPLSPYHYTPLFALIYVPLSWFPFPVAAALNIVLMTAALVLAAVLAAPLFGLRTRLAVVGALSWGPASASVLGGQNVTFALLLVVIFARAMTSDAVRRSPRAALVAGLVTGILAYKPQFAAPALGLSIVRGRALVIGVSLVAFVGQYLVGVVVAGGNLSWPLDLLDSLIRYSAVDLATNGWSAISLPALFARIQLGPESQAVPGLQGLAPLGYVLGAAIAVACIRPLRRMPVPRGVALAYSLGLLVMPEAWVYNATLLLPAIAVVAADAARRGWPAEDRWLLAVTMGIGLTWPVGAVIGVTPVLVPVVLAPAVILGWHPFRARGGDARTQAPAMGAA